MVSIFVNPSQFAPHEDLDAYPRTHADDLQKISKVGAHAVFMPSVAEMYPHGIELDTSKQVGAFVEVKGLSLQLEGQTRPHFFRGVATVMSKLLNIVSPERVYLGAKDMQQTVVLKRLVDDLRIPTKIRICPTVRETDGLAMSSRNKYLSLEQREKAIVLWNALCASRAIYEKDPTATATSILRAGKDVVRQMEAKTEEVRFEYLSLSDVSTLAEIQKVDADRGAFLSGAVRIGERTGRLTRIIDNIFLGKLDI